MLRQRPAVLRDRIYLQRHAIEQVVIVEAAQVDVALHQLMLRQITQHPFQQATGRGEQRFGRTPQLCAQLSEHLVTRAGVVAAVDDPFRFARYAGALRAKLEAGQPIAGRRNARLPAEKIDLIRMLARDLFHRVGGRINRIGDHQRQLGTGDQAVHLHHREPGVDLLVFRVVQLAGGDDQTVDLLLHQTVHCHHLLRRVFIGTGDQQLQTGFAAQRFQLARDHRKAVVGHLRHHQPQRVAAVGAQRAGVDAGLIMVFVRQRQNAIAGVVGHPVFLLRPFSTGLAVDFDTPASVAMSLMVMRLFFH